MTAFADASAVVKLYADEYGADLIATADMLVVSSFTRVEVTAALWRKNRVGELTATDAKLLIDAFQADWAEVGPPSPSYLAVPANATVLEAAAGLCGVHGLRAGDAVQLASALAAREVDPGIDTFFVFDRDLGRAAATEAFDVVGTG